MNIKDRLDFFSLALYSNWFYFKPCKSLFDCGEGAATALGKRIFGIRHMFLSHGHEDHIAGIANLVNVRNIGGGTRDNPLTIYYPERDKHIVALMEYIENKQSGQIQYPLYVQPVRPGDVINVPETKRNTEVAVFESQHTRTGVCLAFEVREKRKVMGDRGNFDDVMHPVFYYSGDGYRSDYRPKAPVDIAVHEATFFAADAGFLSAKIAHRHCTLEKAVEWGAKARVKNLVLAHVSDRYHIQSVIATAKDAADYFGFDGGLFVAWRDELIAIER